MNGAGVSLSDPLTGVAVVVLLIVALDKIFFFIRSYRKGDDKIMGRLLAQTIDRLNENLEELTKINRDMGSTLVRVSDKLDGGVDIGKEIKRDVQRLSDKIDSRTRRL